MDLSKYKIKFVYVKDETKNDFEMISTEQSKSQKHNKISIYFWDNQYPMHKCDYIPV